MKEVKLSTDEKYLILEEIIFKRPKPLKTIEVKVSTANSQPGISSKADFVHVIRNLPDANAFLDLGPIPGKSKTERYKHKDPDIGLIITRYLFYKVELYHLGE